MTDKEALALRVATLKEALEIVTRAGGRVGGNEDWDEDAAANQAANRLDDYIRDLQFHLRRAK